MTQFTAQLTLTALTGVLLLAVVFFLTRMEDWRSYVPTAGGGARTGDHGEHAQHKPAGIVR